VAALLVALTLRERRDLGEAYAEFQRAGLAHTLALSGLHAGILSVFFCSFSTPSAHGVTYSLPCFFCSTCG